MEGGLKGPEEGGVIPETRKLRRLHHGGPLAQELSRTFSQMRDDGTTQQILGKYLKDPQKYMEASSYAND